MINLIRKSVISFGALCVAFFVIILSIFITVSSVSNADDGRVVKDGRLITIHDRGIQKIIVSQGTTIGDALTQAGVTIDEGDLVEPAIEQKLIASDYQVNIYRARPVIVIDGNEKTKILTAYQTAEQIVSEAGIKLLDEDRTTLTRNEDILNDGAGLTLAIDRAISFNFTLYGKTFVARSQASTVGEMLTEKGVSLKSDDHVSISKDTILSEGLAIRVWREGKQIINVDEEIDFDTDIIEDADQLVSYSFVKSIGEKGSRSVSYEVTIQDSVEVGRTEIASIVTRNPKTQIKVIGVKGNYTTPSENETITWNYLIDKGFSKVQTAGIMGNLMQEHRFRTDGDGLAQWIGGRKSALYSRPYPNNIYTQLDFLMEELNGSYSYVKNGIMASDSLIGVVQIFQNQFERCGVCMEGQRISYARDILASH